MVLTEDVLISKWCEQQGTLDIQSGQITPWLNGLPVGGIAIDVGAFIGDTAIALAKKVGEHGCVVAIEANPDAFKCLTHNANHVKEMAGVVAPMLCLLGSGKESGAIITDPNAGASHFSKGGDIASKSLDEICAAAQVGIDFIKIDVEGWEPLVLQGAAQTLAKHKPDLLIEVNHGALARQGFTIYDICNPLEELGYTFKITDPSCHRDSPQFDIFCTCK